MEMRVVLTAALLAWAAASAAERWDLQYFYDEKDSSLEIRDLKFPSLSRGVAVGVLWEGSRARPVSLVTSDGGASWSLSRIREAGHFLFFLNDSVGWMVTDRGIWKTIESGRSWTKLPESRATRGLIQVCFLDENRGWAVGWEKAVYVTKDGGRKWTAVPEAQKVDSSKQFTAFRAIAFADQWRGLIVGRSTPPRPGARGGQPEWMWPERETRMREVPHLMIALSTDDAGKSWHTATASVFGDVSRVALHPAGEALALLRYAGSFQYASEVFAFDWKTGKTTRRVRRTDQAITDIAFSPGGTAFLAAIEQAGSLNWSPIPGRLTISRSADLSSWAEAQVDYRAVARNAILAVVDNEHAWVATDTGMILKLTPE